MAKDPTLKQYVEDIKPSGFACQWTPKGQWKKAHGDGKSSTLGIFRTQTMFDSNGTYQVRVLQGKVPVLGPFTMPGSKEPSAEDVVDEMKKRV